MEYCRLGVVEFKWGFQRLSANTVLMMDNNIDETGAFACFAVKSVSTSKSAISASIVLPLFSPHGLVMAKARTAHSQWCDEPCGP